MSSFYFFLICGLILIAFEIATTTFYLLVIGIAFTLASLFALKFDNWLVTTILAGSFSIIGIIILNAYKHKHKYKTTGKMVVDHIGQTVEIIEINKNNIRVLYSGSYWNAYLKAPTNKQLTIGDKLVITKFSNNNLEVDIL